MCELVFLFVVFVGVIALVKTAQAIITGRL